jgi:hypothetical protein
MARTPFTLKSGNTTSFKDMGSSPARKRWVTGNSYMMKPVMPTEKVQISC